MPTYAIGDVQGCLGALQRLLEEMQFDPARDQLWFVGDLVNRGPDSLAVLRLVKQLGSAAVTVLGNHDLHLLALWTGITEPGRKDTLRQVLDAPDAEALLDWLRFRPLVHAENGHVLVHAGLLPMWSISQVRILAGEVEEALQSDAFQDFLPAIYFRKANDPNLQLNPKERMGLTTNVLTRVRVCTEQGVPEFSFKGPPEEAPAGYLPWFRVPNRLSQQDTIVFGHWSALGILNEPNLLGLDGGCVWGRELVAVRLEDRQLFRISCTQR